MKLLTAILTFSIFVFVIYRSAIGQEYQIDCTYAKSCAKINTVSYIYHERTSVSLSSSSGVVSLGTHPGTGTVYITGKPTKMILASSVSEKEIDKIVPNCSQTQNITLSLSNCDSDSHSGTTSCGASYS